MKTITVRRAFYVDEKITLPAAFLREVVDLHDEDPESMRQTTYVLIQEDFSKSTITLSSRHIKTAWSEGSGVFEDAHLLSEPWRPIPVDLFRMRESELIDMLSRRVPS